MLPRTFFFKLDIGPIRNIEYIKLLEDTLNLHVRYIIKKSLVKLAYEELSVSYNYLQEDIDNAFNAVEYCNDYIILNNIREINHIFETNIVDIVIYYKSRYNNGSTILNFNSCLINLDTYMITCAVLEKATC